jgi:peptidyl-prolyl cis-trans isomerase A (cyclophilin A)
VTRALAALILLPLLAASLPAQEDVLRTVREHLRKLRSDQPEERADAQKKLIEIGAPGLPELIKAVEDSDADYAGRVRAVLRAIAADANPLLKPATLTQTAPDEFKVRFSTSRGDFTVKVTRAWSPGGADRFYNLAKNGFFDDCRFFRVVAGFVCQFGIHGDPEVAKRWKSATIPDDPVKESNKLGRLSFATGGRNSRTTQIFINLKDNASVLDKKGFAPFGEVVDGMEVVSALYADYGEGVPQGKGPDQIKIQTGGNEYLTAFPKLDFVKKAEVLP